MKRLKKAEEEIDASKVDFSTINVGDHKHLRLLIGEGPPNKDNDAQFFLEFPNTGEEAAVVARKAALICDANVVEVELDIRGGNPNAQGCLAAMISNELFELQQAKYIHR